MAVPEQEMQHSLRIGDVILLHSKEGRGFVFSETSSSEHLMLSVFHEVISPDNPNIPDIRMAAFKVLAPNKNKAQERLAKLRKKSQDNKNAMELQNAEKNAKVELKNNELEQERQKGTPVLYGSIIQLLHIYSNKYVTISTVRTSKTENTNMQMYLLDYDSDNCLFKILPRYKVRSVGDEVRMEDQVTFASEKTEGQYIHTSARTYRQVGITLHEDDYEINASATESGYTIKSHYSAMPGEQESIKGGSIIRLFHRELECYLVAEGSFANDGDMVTEESIHIRNRVVVEEVHLRKRKSEHGKLKPPSTSAITYWQIEKDKEPLSGQVVSWGERCRIKHLPTRLYLAIVKEETKVVVKEQSAEATVKEESKGYTYRVMLKKRDIGKTDLDTVFRLFPVIEEETGIKFDSYARINHPHTKTWLVAQKGKHYTRRGFDPNAPGLDSLQWDSAELLQIGVQDQMSYDDAFTLEEIDEELIRKFTYVAGIVPVVKAYIKEVKTNPQKISVKKADKVQKALDELSDFMKYGHPRMKDHQKLLRNLMVLEMVKRVLEKFNPKSPHANTQRRVCQACYRLMEVYLDGDSRKNENYLARFIPLFEKQVGMDLNAEQMLTEIIRDNALIISKYGKDAVDTVITRLTHSKDPRFFDYLGVLCVCNGRPVPENQDNIIKKLVEQYGKDLFYLTEVRDAQLPTEQKKKEIYFHKPGDSADIWYPLSQIAAAEDVKKDKVGKEYQYLVSQLDLFGKLCKGNNASAVHVIDKKFNYLTFEEALVGARDANLHPALRSKYVELIVVLYVDVGDNRAILDNLSLSFIYKDISKDPYKSAAADDTVALTGAVNIYFPELKEWILLHVTEIKSVVASVIDENNLNAEVLDLLYLLVKYGYYDDLDDINALIPSLVSLLNGKNDKPFVGANDDQSVVYREEGRYEDTYVNRAVFNLKVKALKIMDLFFNFRFYIRLQHFIYDYKLLKKEVDPDEKVEAKPDDDDQPTKKQRRFNRFTPAQLQQLTSGITQQVSNVTQQVSHVTQQVTQHVTDLALLRFMGNTDEYPEPPDLLKALERDSHKLKITEPPNENLMHLAVGRLTVIFSLSLFTCDIGTSFSDILIDLSKYQNDELLHESLHLLGRIYSAEENLFEKATQTQLLITHESQRVYTEVQAKLPKLRYYAAIDVNAKQCSELVQILEQFTTLCHLEGDESQAHEQNQKILYNTGVFSDVLDLIFRDKSSRQITSDGVEFVGNVSLDSPEMQQRRLILSKCLQFLRLLAKDNTTVQERLFDRMDDLLELDVAIPEMADLLSEVFTGGQEICLKIKEQQVEQVFFLIAYGGAMGRAELLGMLQAVVKVEKLDLPLKRNQAYIIKYFSKTREKFCNDLLGLEDEKVTRRERLLVKASNTDPDMQMLIKLIDLLASCCEGENLFIESICQNVMGIAELLKILSMHDLDPIRKKPFVRFLLWVYMNTGSDKIQTGSTILFHDGVLWDYLEHVSLLLDGAVKALVNLPSSQIASARENLTSRSTIIRRDPQGFRQRAKTMSNQKNIPFVTGKDGELIPGLLIYLMEGILPMLKVYYDEYFIPYDTSVNTTGDSSERASPEKEIHISGAIACSLMQLSDVIRTLLTSQEQWDLLRATVITITKQSCFEEYPIDPEVKELFDKSVKYVSTPNDALENYNNVYQREVFLNDEFNNFVRNYELAYWGPNTAAYQIGSPYKTSYSEFEDDFLDEKGDEWLPLGKSFQNHIKLYIDIHYSRSTHYSRGTHLPEVTILPHTKRVIDCLESSYNNLADLDEKERQRQDRNDIRYLHLLRTLIHNQVMLVDPDLKEEGQDPALYRMQCKQVASVQNQIQKLGNTVERIVKLLTHPNDKISAEVLAFLSMLLYNGNRNVQEGFGYLMNTREEKLFVSMQQRLKQAALNDRERRILLAQLESRMESQKVLKDTYATQTARRKLAPRPSIQDVLSSPDSTMTASTDQLLDEGRRSYSRNQSVLSDESGDVSTRQRFSMSGEAYEMETFREPRGHGGRVSITDPNYSTARKKKKLNKLSIPELLKEVSETDDEVYEQKIHNELKKRNYVDDDDDDKASSLKFKDTSYIELALRVLGLMCDGQYRLMQNYLREQPDNIKTINLVSETCIFLSSFYVDVTKDNIVLITSVLQTLIEMSVGNYENQKVLFNHQIIDTINRILQTMEVQQCDPVDILELKQTAVELLEAMCEETHTGTEKLVQSIFKGVDIEALHKTLGYFYKLSQDPKMKAEDKDDDAERAAFRTYHVLVHMADFEGISMSDVEPKSRASKNGVESKNGDSDIVKDAWNHCQKWSKSIEVIYENDEDQKVLAQVHFRSYPADEMPEELIEKVKYRVNRDSPEDKTRDFLKWMEGARKEIIHLTALRKHWYTNIFIYNIKWRNYLLIFWTLVMNILLMIAWSDVELKLDVMYSPPEDTMVDPLLSGYCTRLCHNNMTTNSMFTANQCNISYCTEETVVVPTVPDIDNSHWFFDYALYIGGGIHLLMSLAMVISYFLINAGNFVLPDFVYKYILRKKDRNTTYSDEPLFGIRSIYHIVFVACSALSLPFYGYFYCVCLLHIVIDNDILQRVLRSVTKNGRSLLWVGALGLVVLYIYSVGTFAFLPNEFHEPDPEEDGDNVRFCRSLVQCFISVLEYGLLDTLGLTADLPMKFKDAALRSVFYDLTFFIIVTTIGLNIVFGIIVDTFSELRDERWRIEEDKKGTCFICSIASFEFERRAKGFNHHVKHEHCMWDYIYFYLHLERIDVSDHNALESYAYHLIKDGKSDFFPLFNAKSLKATPDETLNQLNEVKNMIAEILEHFHREEKVAALRRKREEQAQWEKENIAEDQ